MLVFSEYTATEAVGTPAWMSEAGGKIEDKVLMFILSGVRLWRVGNGVD